ncbi:MAG: isoleucine--tRNA ligase [Patescibacteria group bacterium]
MPFQPVDPKISFPKLEQEILQFWEDRHIFAKSLEKPSPKGEFVFYEGPPTANGMPGIHHVLARAFKDSILRYKTMQGYVVPRRAGWDTHGLPVELQVEKQLGISGKPQIETLKATKDESIAEFNRLCHESVWQYTTEWETLTRRMGFWLDMDDPYVTYENKYIESVWGVLGQAWKKDLMYRGHKVVPYCYRCGTALSSHEVAQGYKDITDQTVYVEFELLDEPGTRLIAWTTTPWTLPGNVAVAVNPKLTYVVIEKKDEGVGKLVRFIVAKERLSALFGEEQYTILNEYTGSSLIGKKYKPLFNLSQEDNAYQVIAGDFVSDTDGTGIVHIAPAFGEDDYNLKVEHNLPILFTVTKEGVFTPEVTQWAGKVAVNQNENIIKYLDEQGSVFKKELYKHSYPHCWRCDSKLIYYAKDSWFIAMSRLKDQLLQNNEHIHWVPDNIKEGRFGEWLANIKDWNLSRDRFWGTPMPIWENEDRSEYAFINSIAELKERATNFDAVYSKSSPILDSETGISTTTPTIDLHRPYIDQIIIPDSQGRPMHRVPEVLDVWFDSGSMPYATGTPVPADFISEAIDQTRGWFYTLHAIATILDRGPAFKNVICLGHILDSKGQKMSKSKGNVLDPIAIADAHGFDAIRWYMYTVNQPGETKRVGEDDIKEQVRKFLLILWNTYSFFVTYANLNNFDPKNTKKVQSTNLFDQWLISKREGLVKKVTTSLDQYDIFTATRSIEDFVMELSTWYVRRNKKRDDATVFLAILHETLVTISQLIAPFTPFLSEELYQKLTGNISVHLSTFPEADEKLINLELEASMSRVQKIVEMGHSLRKEHKIKNRQPLSELLVQNIEFKATVPDELRAIIADELNVKAVNSTEQIPKGEWAQRDDQGIHIALDLTITPSLRAEAMKNDLIRLIQDARKEARYGFSDLVHCSIETESPDIQKILVENGEEIMNQGNLHDIAKTNLPNPDATLTSEIEGASIIVSVKK